jgi:hypothetical protein
MTRSRLRWVVAFICLVGLASSSRPVVEAKDLPGCGPKSITSNMVYPPLEVNYVGGSIPGVELRKQHPFLWLGTYQFRKAGCLAMGVDTVVFVFKSKSKQITMPSSSKMQVIECSDAKLGAPSPDNLSPEGRDLCKAVKEPTPEGQTPQRGTWHVMQIPYANINVLGLNKWPRTGKPTQPHTLARLPRL